ncbi:MAG: HAMP domain-containing protein [Endomicrobiales bacterium]|nr:HAMP domain-containing protein [Endomicrobiales bacterium]
MKRTLFTKILAAQAILIILILSAYYSFTVRELKNAFISSSKASIENLLHALAPQTAVLLETGGTKELTTLCSAFTRSSKYRLTVIDPRGVVLVDTENEVSGMGNHIGRPEVQEALTNTTGFSMRFSSTAHEDFLYGAAVLKSNGRHIGFLRVSAHLKDIKTFLATFNLRMLQLAIFLFLGAIVFAFIATRRFSRPISELVSATKSVSEGNLQLHVSIEGSSEMNELSLSFNNMVERLRALIAETELQKNEILAILGSMSESLAVFDENGVAKLSNTSFNTVFNVDKTEGRHYWELIRDRVVSEFIENAIRGKSSSTDEFTLKSRNYVASASYITQKNECVFILTDVTTLKNLEAIKKDLVTNVSHELRTPLTAIKGYAETLAEVTDKKHAQYCRIIIQHTDRLISIVKDILTLSNLESPSGGLEISDLSVKSLIDNAAAALEYRIKESGLEINISVDPALTVKGDAFKLEQVLINLLDNAVKYTEKGTVSLRAEKKDGTAVIEVSDTGIGIPAEHIDRIFERFYVVNKSRSRESGGTGLGLSIVKHIVQLHGGSIRVASSPGAGTVFTVELPA